MGSFRYCLNCDKGHDKPSILNDLIPHYRITCKCGATMPQYMNEIEWMIDLSDRIEKLEKMLGLNNKL